jgi:predicted transposase YbfD/YdcC
LLCAAVAAVLTGARSLLAISEWIADAPQQVLGTFGFAIDPLTGFRPVPHAATVRRLLHRIDGDALDAALCAYLQARTPLVSQPEAKRTVRRVIAVDGKVVRGSRTKTATAIQLLAAMDHHGVVLAQRQIAAKSNEIPSFQPLLGPLDLENAVLTTDALHTQHDHGAYLIGRGAHYMAVVKKNQCATRRSDTSPLQAGQTRREVCWVRWLTWIRKVKGTRACQETGDRAQVPGTVRRGTRVVWRKLDCLNPNLRRQQFTATGTAPETGARRDRGRTGSPWSTFAAGAMPNEGIEGDEWGAWAALIVCQRRTWDHRPSTAGGDGVPVVVAGVTPGRGERESRSQGEGAQVVRTPATPGRYAKCRALTQCSVS